MSNNGSSPLVLWYNQLGMNDVDRVGGKNASLGEMITNLSGMGVSVPNGLQPLPMRLTSFGSKRRKPAHL
ncbi:phosphoenolpyruvate synthase [Salmonella enterica subsp. enterica]|nr:phosphoenolpyruvate synthase [Salmonella enterica subsp. enterica] [Salmonella enterica subsp. enterica serovar Menston]